jgi:hypothetical protein
MDAEALRFHYIAPTVRKQLGESTGGLRWETLQDVLEIAVRIKEGQQQYLRIGFCAPNEYREQTTVARYGIFANCQMK